MGKVYEDIQKGERHFYLFKFVSKAQIIFCLISVQFFGEFNQMEKGKMQLVKEEEGKIMGKTKNSP